MAEKPTGQQGPGRFDREFVGANGANLDVAAKCILIAEKALAHKPNNRLQLMAHYLVATMTNAIAAVCVLCRNGQGVEAIRVARGAFEGLVTLKYFVVHPDELDEFLEFDWIERWNRLQFYRANFPTLYDQFPASKKFLVESEYDRVKARFTGKRGRVRRDWCRHSLFEMAQATELAELYGLFYRYASSLHHVTPMGLAMSINAKAGDVLPAPRIEHTGIALALGGMVLGEAAKSLGRLYSVDYDGEISELLDAIGDVADAEAPLGSLTEVFPRVQKDTDPKLHISNSSS